jgi:adenine-specific DNA glycosylase
MMELGATICAPRSPQCLVCPVAEFCEARRLGLTEAIPQKRKKRGGVDVTLAALVMVDAGELTLLLPPPSPSNTAAHGHDVAALLSRLWHFPTIEVQRDAKSELQNFSRQSLLLEDSLVSGLLPLTKVCHTVTYRTITIESFRLDLGQLPRIAGAKKLPLHDVGSVAISGLTRKVARAALTGRCRCRPKKSEGTPVLAL